MAAALSFTSIAATFFLIPGQREAHVPLQPAEKQGLAFGLFISGFALFAERRFYFQNHPFGAKEAGYIFAYAGLVGILIQGAFIGRLVAGMSFFLVSNGG